MAKYRNPRIEQELMEDELEVQENEIQNEAPKTVDEQVWKQRYGDLRRLMNERDAQYRAETEELRNAVNAMKQQSMKPPKSEEEINAWKSAYPEFAEILDTIVNRTVEGQLAKERPKFKELERTQEEIKREKALMALKRKFPDCETWFKPDHPFHEWLLAQPKMYQDFIYRSTDVDGAVLVLGLYTNFLNETSKGDERPADRNAAKAVRTRSGSPAPEVASGEYWYSESEIQKKGNDAKWWDANEERIFEAQAKGKILLDISGGAR